MCSHPSGAPRATGPEVDAATPRESSVRGGNRPSQKEDPNLTDIETLPPAVAAEASSMLEDHPESKVARVPDGDDVWIVARDGRTRRFTGTFAFDHADDQARRWARELGGSGKREDELEQERVQAGAVPEDEPQRWSTGFMRPRAMPVPPPMPLPWDRPRRCEASLSAESYRRHTPKAEYDQERWQWLDGGHERCPHPVRRLAPTPDRWYGFCGRHDPGPGGQFFPYIEPGPGCAEPCCRRSHD